MNRMCLLIPAFLYSCLQLGQIKRPLEDLSNLLNDPKVYLEDDIKIDLNPTLLPGQGVLLGLLQAFVSKAVTDLILYIGHL